MKRIDRVILRSYMGPFVMAFFIVIFILVMQFMSLYMKEIIGKGLGMAVLGRLFLYAAGRLVLLSMPVAILAAALMTFGSMGEHNELAAIKSSGISLFKTMRSVLGFAVLLTGVSLWMSFQVIPEANLKFFSLLYDVQRKKADVAITPGYFYTDIDNYVIRVSDKNVETGMLYDVMIFDHSENRGNANMIVADSAKMGVENEELKMVLFHGSRYEEYEPERDRENYPHGRTYFDSLYYKFRLEGFDLSRTDENQFRHHQITLSQPDLTQAIDSIRGLEQLNVDKGQRQIGRYTKLDSTFRQPGGPLAKDTTLAGRVRSYSFSYIDLMPGDTFYQCLPPQSRSDAMARAVVNARAVKSYAEFMVKKAEDQQNTEASYLYEWHLRYALPINCLFFMLIGASLGAIIRKGGLGMPSLLSISLFLAFYVLTTYGKKTAREGVWEPWLGAWVSVLVFTPLAIYVTYQATTDSKLLDESVWNTLRDRLSFALSKLNPRFWGRGSRGPGE